VVEIVSGHELYVQRLGIWKSILYEVVVVLY